MDALPPSSNFQMLPVGQGLLETTIAIGVIVTGLFSVFTLVLANARSGDTSADRFVALQYAREGVEVVRALRDANGLRGVSWDRGFAGTGTDTTAVPVFDPAGPAWSLSYAPERITSRGAAIVRVTRGGRTYFTNAVGVVGGAPTPYRRLLTLDPICSNGMTEEVRLGSATCATGTRVGYRVRSDVEWVDRGATRHVDIETMLYDWR